ncbi:MAG: PD-(D/E)XK nuclease family protein, partial [Lachnospiraceae bacterium]|nr:PD-(D/E)XK nuclease family protein [Lachnospiraceae bacterium]
AQTGFLDQSQADVLKSRDFYRFIQSDIGRRMKAAALSGSLKREQPFCVLIPADRVNSAFPAEEEILVQGIIDALFMEEGEYVIVDYKTDNVKAMEELADLYSTQLRYYAMAIEQITGVPVKERVIYSVKMGDQIRV